MAFQRRKAAENQNLNLVSMIDVTSFILMSLAILAMSMKKEASLDNILRLPSIGNADKQDTAQLQLYILPAKIRDDGSIDPDSTGLVAFTGKSKPPDACDGCGALFRDENKQYVPNSLLDAAMRPLATMGSENQAQSKEEREAMEQKAALERPPVYYCAKCKKEISPYLKLDEIPVLLKKEKKKVLDEFVATENYKREEGGNPPLNKEQIKRIEDEIPLMIKADDKAFYGRIILVVNTVKDTSCNIKKFAFISSAEAAAKAQKARNAAAQKK